MTNRIRALMVAVAVASALAIYLGLRSGRRAGASGPDSTVRPTGLLATAPDHAGGRPGEAIPLTREGLVAFLTTLAKPAEVLPGQTTYLFPELRGDALEGLALVQPEAAAALLQDALTGDGDPDSWPADRLLAALLRLRAGQADGGEVVKAWLQANPVPSEAEGVAAAAEAASWMGAVDGAAVVRQMLGAPLEDYDQDHLAAILQTAAALNAGATLPQLQAVVAGGLEAWGFRVLGAAAGALKRRGDDSGQKVLDLAAADDWFEADEVAVGLGSRGNTTALLWLDQLLGCDEASARAQAARSLRIVGDAGAVPMLLKAVEDEDPGVRAEAGISLAVLGDTSALAQVREGTASTNPGTAIDAWKVLAGRGDREARAAAEKVLATPLPAADDLRRGPALRQCVWAAVVVLRSLE